MASAANARRLSDRDRADRYRAGRPGRQLLRELRLRVAAQLSPLLRRGDLAADRSAIAGAEPSQAPRAGSGNPEKARGGCGPPRAGVAAGLLHGLAVCEEPGSSPIHIQLGPHAGGVARQVTYARCSSRAGDTRMWPHGAEDPVLGRADESSLCQNYRPATVAIGQNR